MLVSRNDLVRESHMECLGVGDTSLVKYLSELMLPLVLSTAHAVTAGSYIVKQVKDFVDGCGGGTHIVTLRDGHIILSSQPEDFTLSVEYAAKRLILALSETPVTNDKMEEALMEFSKRIRFAYTTWP